MKKWLIITGALVVLLLLVVAVAIPSRLTISGYKLVNVTMGGASRILQSPAEWNKWWPSGERRNTAGSYAYGGYTYQFTKAMYHAVALEVKNEVPVLNTTLLLIPFRADTVRFEWSGVLAAGANPFKKISAYFEARQIKLGMDHLLDSLKSFLEKKENIYGIPVTETTIRDTSLIATTAGFGSYPTTQDIYGMVGALQQYIAQHQARETNYPMLNIKKDSTGYTAMVAIPVNKELPNQGRFITKRMIPSPVLVTEVKGGPAAVAEAHARMENYIQDYHRMKPVKDYESLVTDRSREPDTTRWITRVNYPVF